MNKFLNQYPQLVPPRVGTIIKIVRDGRPYYSKGDIGKIVGIIIEGTHKNYTTYAVDFTNRGNSAVHGNGQWYTNRSNMEVIGYE